MTHGDLSVVKACKRVGLPVCTFYWHQKRKAQEPASSLSRDANPEDGSNADGDVTSSKTA